MRSGGFVFLLLADIAAAVELLSHSLAPFPHYGLGFNLTLQLSEPVLGLEVTWARTDGEGDALRLDVGFDDIDDDDGSSVNYTAVSKDSFVAVELLRLAPFHEYSVAVAAVVNSAAAAIAANAIAALTPTAPC